MVAFCQVSSLSFSYSFCTTHSASAAQGMMQDTDRKHSQSFGFTILFKTSSTLVSAESALSFIFFQMPGCTIHSYSIAVFLQHAEF
jgi:hypothetical protein